MLEYARILNERRNKLGLSYEILESKTGVSASTIYRLLSGKSSNISLERYMKIAEALECVLEVKAKKSELDVRKDRAKIVAERVAKIVQGTSSLEQQGLSKKEIASIKEETFHQLMAGSKRDIWHD